MKLAKKMLAGVLALAMVAALALTAFAAAPAINLTATKAVVGQEMTVTVSGKDIAGLMSADFEFVYDAEVLQFVSSTENAEGFIAAAGSPEAGLTTLSVIYATAASADATFCTYTFKVLKAGDTEIKVNVGSVDGLDNLSAAPLKIVATDPNATTAAPTTVAPTTAAPTTAAPTEATSKVPTTGNKIPQTGEAGVAAIAGVMVLAAVAFVATRKKDEE